MSEKVSKIALKWPKKVWHIRLTFLD